MNNSEILKEQFSELEVKYHYIAGILKGIFEDRLGIQNIGYARVLYRIKSWESFLEKINRKGYSSPFEEIDDICGFRIIMRNSAELNKIVEIIKSEFDVREAENKDTALNPDQFGYRSHHIVASIKKEWMAAPPFRNCEDLKFEIQIRSELMDAWANISHQIFYKKGSHSKSVTRRLYRLSALMEIGDSEISQIIASQSINNKLSHEEQDLQNTLDQFLPDRRRAPENMLITLLEEMKLYNFALKTLTNYLETRLDKLLKIEQEAFSEYTPSPAVESRWWQIGVVRGFMYLTIDEYWLKEGKGYGAHFVSVIESNRSAFLN